MTTPTPLNDSTKIGILGVVVGALLLATGLMIWREARQIRVRAAQTEEHLSRLEQAMVERLTVYEMRYERLTNQVSKLAFRLSPLPEPHMPIVPTIFDALSRQTADAEAFEARRSELRRQIQQALAKDTQPAP